MIQGSQVAVEVVGPIGDDRIERDVVDGEVQVDVGPAVLSLSAAEPVTAAPVIRRSFSASLSNW